MKHAVKQARACATHARTQSCKVWNSTTHYPEYSVDMWCRQEIIEKLHGQVVRLSQHKFASNVIEKCLQYGDSNSRQVISLCLMQQQPLLHATLALASYDNSPCFMQH